MKDFLLVNLVSMANRGTLVNVTLLINGSLYSGTLISYEEFCNSKLEGKALFSGGLSKLNEEEEPNYLHLKNVSITPNVNLNIISPLRIKIEDVSGFIVEK